jgi:hypothetical protein
MTVDGAAAPTGSPIGHLGPVQPASSTHLGKVNTVVAQLNHMEKRRLPQEGLVIA